MNGAGAAAVQTGDADLLTHLRAGGSSAYAALMRRHNQRLYRLARGILRDDAEAEEAVQEGYVPAFTHLDGFKGEASLATWLARIVLNEALGRLRRRPPTVDIDDLAGMPAAVDGAPTLATSEPSPEQAIARLEIRRAIERAVDGLPATFRSVFILRAIEQMTIEQTAACLGIPGETAKTRLHRANKLLRGRWRRDSARSSATLFRSWERAATASLPRRRRRRRQRPTRSSRPTPIIRTSPKASSVARFACSSNRRTTARSCRARSFPTVGVSSSARARTRIRADREQWEPMGSSAESASANGQSAACPGLLLAESVERHDLAGLFHRLLLLGGGGLRGRRLRLARRSLELQAEFDRRIGEGGDGVERDDEPLGLVLEAQGHGEALLRHLEIPELVLENHGHLLGILLAEIVRQRQAGKVGAEGDVEVMGAGEAFGGGAGERFANHAAQRRFDHFIVS